MRRWKWQCRLWMKYTGTQARFWCAAIWMSIGAAGRDNGSSIADIKNNWNHPADPAWTDPAHSGSGAICSGAVSGEWQHRGEDDRPDYGDMAFACGKLEGSVRRGRVFFTAADLWDHPEREKAGRWRTRGG